jgi:phospholipid transport system substrate-binding protein
MKIAHIIILALGFIFIHSSYSEAQNDAKTTITEAVNKVKSEVTTHGGKISPEELDKKLRAIIEPAFDFQEMSRRCLGVNWNKATPDERKEFTDLFSTLLARNYLKQIRENAKDSEFKIISSSEEGRRSLVQTIVKTPKEEIKIDYRLYSKDKEWKVYDVIIENIGLVSNYRSEFAGIIKHSKVSGLIDQLRTKVK